MSERKRKKISSAQVSVADLPDSCAICLGDLDDPPADSAPTPVAAPHMEATASEGAAIASDATIASWITVNFSGSSPGLTSYPRKTSDAGHLPDALGNASFAICLYLYLNLYLILKFEFVFILDSLFTSVFKLFVSELNLCIFR